MVLFSYLHQKPPLTEDESLLPRCPRPPPLFPLKLLFPPRAVLPLLSCLDVSRSELFDVVEVEKMAARALSYSLCRSS